MYFRWRSPGSIALGTVLLLGFSAANTTASAQSADQSTEVLPPVVVETDLIVKPSKKARKATKTHDADSGGAAAEGAVVSSANRAPMDAAKVGSTVNVVTKKDIDSRSQTYLKDYLETLPGVSFSQYGPPGTQAGISVRGAGGKYVKVLVDGMDFSDPSATSTRFAFEHLLVGDVSRIELVQGTQSTLYGGDAIAGVITVDTNTATKLGFSQSGGVEYGAYNTFRGAYSAGYLAQDGSNISVTAQGLDSDGFSASATGTEDDGYRNLTLSARGEYYLTQGVKVFFAARTLDADLDIDGGATSDNSDTVDITQQTGRVGTELSLFDGALVNTFAYQAMENERAYHGSRPHDYVGKRQKAEHKSVLSFNRQLALIAGAEWEETTAQSYSVNDESADTTGYFAQLVMEPIDGLVLTGGGRLDEHSQFGSFNTHRLTGAYLIPGTETKLRASYGTGFRVPSLDELFGAYPAIAAYREYGNPNLEPETSKSWDVGIDQGLMNGKVQLGATYFELDTDNLIDVVCVSDTSPCTKYKNANIPGVTHRHGVELTAAAPVTPGLTLHSSYSYVETETEAGDRLTCVPRHSIVVGIDIEPLDEVAINVTAKGVADIVGPGKVSMDDYLLVSAKASYELLPGMQAYVRGENLLDEDYQTYQGYGTAGLSVFGGLRVSLSDN
jgi:vitamin B12 transporter